MPRCRRWISRRSCFLLLFGLAYLLVAKSLIDTDLTPAGRHVFRFALGIMHLVGWAIMWLVCGLLAIGDAALTRHGRDALGFAAAVFAPTVWAVVYFIAWAGNDSGVRDLWLSAVLYGLIAGAVLIVAGMPDPSTVRRAIRRMERSGR